MAEYTREICEVISARGEKYRVVNLTPVLRADEKTEIRQRIEGALYSVFSKYVRGE